MAPTHVQVAEQLFGRINGYRIFLFDLAPGAQKQLRIVDDAVLYIDRALAPGLIDLGRLRRC